MLCCIKHKSGSFGTKVSRLNMCRSKLSLRKIAHQMWCDHPFSQRSRSTGKTVGVGVEGDRKLGVVVVVDKNWKKGGGVVANTGGVFIK